jgi:uncharacterized protein (TIGR02145 family)
MKRILKNPATFLIMLIMVVATAFTFTCSGDDEVNLPDNCVDERGAPCSATGDSSSSGGNSSSSSDGNGGNDIERSSFEYGGKTYKTVKIGNQWWMAENMNYYVEGSKCYGEEGIYEEIFDIDLGRYEAVYKTISPDEIQANCDTYGRNYDWEMAMEVCSSGWHLPNDDEWDILIVFAGGRLDAGLYLKAAEGWDDDRHKEEEGLILSGNGYDTYGFAALPGGRNIVTEIGRSGTWWSASEVPEYLSRYSEAFTHKMSYREEESSSARDRKIELHSVRCIKD